MTTTSALMHARDMTDAEFGAANRRRAWRDVPVTKPPANSAGTDSRRDDRRAIGSTSSTATPPAPGIPQGVKPALTMTDREFAEACRARAWRTGLPSR